MVKFPLMKKTLVLAIAYFAIYATRVLTSDTHGMIHSRHTFASCLHCLPDGAAVLREELYVKDSLAL